ncbi:GAF domain-containing sensor histidine kinase [Mucilaginibacter ximonensis]|uniref:histidine kinase n=1 Tax=Mucilaginibacter ximonensis TaxID=538021 RepID=A0ABW5Y9Z8_9SPHI
MSNAPIPANEMDRLLNLAELDLDYTNYDESFDDLAKLAAKVAGTDISLVNLIDAYTQWSISRHGLDIEQMPREDSVCQYTVMGNTGFEVKDLSSDERFKDKFYVVDDPNLRYYYGVPLTSNGTNLGALCVLDEKIHEITPEKAELLKIIADEIVNRLKGIKLIKNLKNKLNEANEDKKKVAHDIRGPLGGIIGLAQVISEQGHENQIDEVLEFINMIHKSGRSILELADEILSSSEPRPLKADEFNLSLFKDKLEKLYMAQARNKKIKFAVNISPENANTPFSKNKLLQIVGNLISNAIKFTPEQGDVTVSMDIESHEGSAILRIKVSDTGIGLNQEGINKILDGNMQSNTGTGGEVGYGFGLALVKHLIESLNGKLHIDSQVGQGTSFKVSIPVVRS